MTWAGTTSFARVPIPRLKRLVAGKRYAVWSCGRAKDGFPARADLERWTTPHECKLLQAAAQGLSSSRLVSGLKLARHARTVCRIRVSVVARVWLSRHKERVIRLGTRTDCRFRASVLLIGISCALWALWLLGRAHQHLPVLKPTTTTPQPRRKSIVQDGISAFTNASKHGQVLSFTTPPKPRVLDYLRTFAPLAKVDVMQ